MSDPVQIHEVATARVWVVSDFPAQFVSNNLSDCLACSVEVQSLTEVEFSLFEEFQGEHPDWVVVLSGHKSFEVAHFSSTEAGTGMVGPTHANRLAGVVDQLLARHSCTVLIGTLPDMDDGVYGSRARQYPESLRSQALAFNQALIDYAGQTNSVRILDIGLLWTALGKEAFHPGIFYSTRISWSIDLSIRVAEVIAAHVSCDQGQVSKCLILDLDNTLWGGVIGDDGLERIELGELGNGRIFVEIQRWAKKLKQRGVLLAVCSKNEMEHAKLPFEEHPDCVLTLDDFAAFEANWESKVENIQRIQSLLNVGFDSLVFIDDNPHERLFVRSQLPDVKVPELPEDPADWLPFLAAGNFFEVSQVTTVDLDRTTQYQQASMRFTEQQRFTDEADFLNHLQLRSEVKPLDSFSLPRVAQMTQRTNQFNLRTTRYTEEKLAEMMDDPRFSVFTFSLRDRIGDYGIVGIYMLEETPRGLFIDTWLLSCRVFNKTLEHAMLNHMVGQARERKEHLLIGEYLPTAKNKPVAELFSDLGFTPDRDRWLLPLADWKNFNSHVEIQAASSNRRA